MKKFLLATMTLSCMMWMTIAACTEDVVLVYRNPSSAGGTGTGASAAGGDIATTTGKPPLGGFGGGFAGGGPGGQEGGQDPFPNCEESPPEGPCQCDAMSSCACSAQSPICEMVCDAGCEFTCGEMLECFTECGSGCTTFCGDGMTCHAFCDSDCNMLCEAGSNCQLTSFGGPSTMTCLANANCECQPEDNCFCEGIGCP